MLLPNTSLFLKTLMFVVNETAVRESDNSYNSYFVDIGVEMNSTRCYGSYGCFGLNPPWTSDHRPVSVFPESINKVQPKYFFYTRHNPTTPIYFDLNEHDVMGSAGFDPHKPIYVISHGFTEDGYKQWIIDMTSELLKREDCSVIVVDWEGGSSPPYTQAVANIRLVGAVTAQLFELLSRLTGNKKLDHVHCIGHSLGAHLSAYIGYTLQKNFNLTLGRITGLDPAEPHFAKNKPPVRLDRSAAKYVDIIHTDASAFIRGGLGITERIGHVDFYPNGGTNQPGCTQGVVEYISLEKSFFKGVKKYLGCNHHRSYEFFIESINSKCPLMSISCPSYEHFQNGTCIKCGENGHHCLTFGMHSNSSYKNLLARKRIRPEQNLIQYLMTGMASPFCKSHFRISVEISNSADSQTHGGEIGQLWFVMHSTSDGSGEKSSKVALNAGGYHQPGATYTFVVPADGIPKLKAVEVEWQYNSMVFNPLTWRILATPKLYVSKVRIDGLEIHHGITVCPKDYKPLLTGVAQLMIPSYCT